MLNNDLSSNMQDAVDKLLEEVNKKSAIANITFLFTSPNYPDVKIFLSREINKLTIEQDYVLNFTDKITAELTLGRDPYVTLVNMRKNLFCRLQITYVDPGSPEPEAPVPDFDILYKCAITSFEDIYKKVPKEKITPTDRAENDYDYMELKMSVELIADDVYKARKQQMHLVARNAYMANILNYTVNYFGFKNAVIVTPDNKRKYTNFVIPPAYGVENIMAFLQTSPGLGVYDNGFNSYICNGCWYVYPRYGLPIPRCPIHVYSVGLNKFTGLSRYDYEEPIEGAASPENKITHILCNSGMVEKNWSDIGSENGPTAATVQISEAVLDGTRKLIKDGKMDVVKRISHYANIPSNPMDMEQYIKVKYLKSDGNLHTIKSGLRISQGTTMNFDWIHARPWVFRPSMLVQIHYDGPNGYDTVEGMCEGATYTFVPDPQYTLEPRFTCSANVTVNCNNVKKA